VIRESMITEQWWKNTGKGKQKSGEESALLTLSTTHVPT